MRTRKKAPKRVPWYHTAPAWLLPWLGVVGGVLTVLSASTDLLRKWQA